MTAHPLKLVSLGALIGLMATQLSLLYWLPGESRFLFALVLLLPLLAPLRGLLSNRRYTFKWVGFLAMLYFAIGVSEAFSSEDLRLYGTATIACSLLLFISSIYYSRYLR